MIAISFDGGWDVYIDDFARTSVLQDWAEFLVHCEGYPDAAGVASLSLGEQKEVLTAHQVTAALNYQSYPDVTAKGILKALLVQAAFPPLLGEASPCSAR